MSDFPLAEAILAADSDAEIDDAARIAVLRDALTSADFALIPTVLDDGYRALADDYIARRRRHHAESAAMRDAINRHFGSA